MRTEEWVTLLAAGPVAADSRVAVRRYAIGVGWAAFGSTLLMAVLLGVQIDLSQSVLLPMFWVKLGVAALVAAIGIALNLRLGRPGAALGRLPLALAAPVALWWTLAVVALVGAAPGDRVDLVLGRSWLECLVHIAVLSVPGLAAILWSMRGLAPTRLRLAGAAAGLLAGSIGATAYALYCPELAAPFLAVWYVLGVAIPAAAGALLGPSVLRW
jgi:hypothetical protein